MYYYPTKYILRNVIAFFIVVFINLSGFAQLDCPLNTPIFPFQNEDDAWDEYAWSSNLYTPGQMGGAQTINQISFRMDNHNTPGYSYTYTDFRIYIRHTSVNDFAASDPDYPGTAGFTLCYSGSFTISSPGVYTFNLTTPFVYNGANNLEVMFQNHGVDDNTSDDNEEPWYDRTNERTDGVHPGKTGVGTSWTSATSTWNTNTWPYNLQINNVTCGAYPLPVTLISSTLKCEHQNAVLSWSTASEQNNDYFTIEVSENGKVWREIRRIDGAGNTNEERDYNEELSNDFSYYRLSQTDYDGTRSNLNTFASNCSKTSELHVYPNPANDVVRVSLTEPTLLENIRLVDLKGVTMEIPKHKVGKHEIILDVNDLKAGVYLLYVKQEGEYRTKRITVL